MTTPFLWITRSVVYLTPILLSVVKNRAFLPEKVRLVVVFCQNHLGTLYQIVAVVSCVALIYFGQPFFGVSSLVILGIGAMDRNGLLPPKWREIFHEYSQPLLIVVSMVSARGFDLVFGAFNAASWCLEKFFSQKKALRKTVPIQGNLTPKNITDFFKGQLPVRINRKFLDYTPFPPPPEIDIAVLLTKFDQINWPKHINVLRKKLAGDTRFIEQHRTTEGKSDDKIIGIAKKTLEAFVQRIKGESILEGAPRKYETLKGYVKSIAKHVVDEPNETTRTDILFRLAVEGGEYCGSGKFEVAESVYTEIFGTIEVSFKDRVITCLQHERKKWMDRFYQETFIQGNVGSTIGRIVDWNDVHNYNTFLNLYGDEFGLLKAAADNDDTAVIGPLTKLVISLTIQKMIRKRFWEEHTEYNHIDILNKVIGTPELPVTQMYDFWTEWVKRQKIGQSAKDALIEELSNGMLYGRPLMENGKLRYDFGMLMLLEMGILEIDPKASQVYQPERNPLPVGEGRGFGTPSLAVSS